MAATAACAAGLLAVWLAVGQVSRDESLEELIEVFDEPPVMVDADPEDAPPLSLPDGMPPVDDPLSNG